MGQATATVTNNLGVVFAVEVLTTPPPTEYAKRLPDGRPVPVVRFTEGESPHRRVAEYYADTLLMGRSVTEASGLMLQGQVRGWHLDPAATSTVLRFVEGVVGDGR